MVPSRTALELPVPPAAEISTAAGFGQGSDHSPEPPRLGRCPGHGPAPYRYLHRPMPFEPLPLNVDTLTALLNEGAERAELDYKERCDLNDTFEVVSIVKDIGAMQIQGGYLVIGADDRGQPSGKVTPEHARLFDQATVESKFGRYLP